MRMSVIQRACISFWGAIMFSAVSSPIAAGGAAAGQAALNELWQNKDGSPIVATEAAAVAGLLGNLSIMTPAAFLYFLATADEFSKSSSVPLKLILFLEISSLLLAAPFTVVGAIINKEPEKNLGYFAAAGVMGSTLMLGVPLAFLAIIIYSCHSSNSYSARPRINNAPYGDAQTPSSDGLPSPVATTP